MPGNASSDSDSKGSMDADRERPKKKTGSFRRRKHKDHGAQGLQEEAATPLVSNEDRLYDTVGVMSPEDDGVRQYLKCSNVQRNERNERMF